VLRLEHAHPDKSSAKHKTFTEAARRLRGLRETIRHAFSRGDFQLARALADIEASMIEEAFGDK